ncbi:hypothetical protein CPT_Muldoon_043 [Serratia phage Muldoon]|uniref:Superinfection immunity protein n=1 Tax=Serratia phage Muldoon TaxID=2601678 RepID=A0A5P8PH52_9CAUD|nr:immunity to superinfection [Serratia phage Muldoon]QFR55999.1 hypothetical protein CPT_Muldoon_043 [Serratia phage Muldoon]
MIEGLVGLAFAFVVYMLPWIVALARKHKQTTAIFVGSLFTNWTGIGWVIMLIWSVMK